MIRLPVSTQYRRVTDGRTDSLRHTSCDSMVRYMHTNQLDVRPSRLVTVRDRSFGSVGPKLWNSLPDDIRPLHRLHRCQFSERN